MQRPSYFRFDVLDAGDDMFAGSSRSSEDVVPVRATRNSMPCLCNTCALQSSMTVGMADSAADQDLSACFSGNAWREDMLVPPL